MTSNQPQANLTDDLICQIEEALGSFKCQRTLSHPYGINTVLALETDRYGLVIFKQYHQARRYHQERTFLHNYSAVLGIHAPHIIADLGNAASTDPVMLLSGLGGEIVDQANILSDEERELCFEHAGQLLCTLHEQPYEDLDPMRARDAVLVRLATVVQQAVDYEIEATDLERARTIVGSAEIFAEVTRVPCHRDFSPRNWLFEPATNGSMLQINLIDFDMARPDLRIGDFLRLRDEYTYQKPELWQAFIRGYGWPLRATEEIQLQHLSIISAIATIIWARQFKDPPFEQTARRILAQRLAE